MHIALCGSLVFYQRFGEVQAALEATGHTVTIPISAKRILDGEIALTDINTSPDHEAHAAFTIKNDAIRRYYKEIEGADAILVVNEEKRAVPGYIGGNTFLEMGFAHILHKPIYVLHPLPDMGYTDEMEAMQPIVLNGDIKKLTV